MKHVKIAAALLVLMSLLASLLAQTSAEVTNASAWQADILKLIDAKDAPAETRIKYDLRLPADAQTETRVFEKDLVSSNNDTLRVEVTFLLNGISISDSEWSEISVWLDALVTRSVQSVQADSESLANVIAEAIAEQRRSATTGGASPAWAKEGLLVQEICAAVPYFSTLSVGSSGASTSFLQAKLKQLGYLDDKVDGYYGNNTKAAVEALENYVRELEQDMIDALPEPTPTPTPAPTATPEPNHIALTINAPAVTPEPPEPTPAPTPVTPVDGVADPLLQAYLFSDSFQVTRGPLQTGESGDAVLRLQRRLRALGYMADAADGNYGGSTARSVRIFQYYNALELTGVADVETQQALFADSAIQPDNSLLSVGSSGDAVSKLQKNLRVLGFAALSIDGDFGNSTRVGVETLQKYMQELERERLGEDAGADAQPSIEVNGIADPMLLDDFYADTFPAIPAAMGSGSSGRDVVRLQRRLNMLEYYYDGLDGAFGSGTASAVKAFQKRNGLTQTGEADTDTLRALFNENAKKALKPYVLQVSIKNQRVYAYAPDANGNYTDLVRTMKCSTGLDKTPTPTGTFQSGTGPGARWHYFTKFKCWAQYAYYISGDIMFHSVLYTEKEGSVKQSSVNNLGSKASHGCVRLSVEDAEWIWRNCPTNTKIIIE